MNILKITLLVSVLFASQTSIASDPLLSLKNLERERASFIALALKEESDTAKKYQKTARKLMQLSDMERMVIRDDRLVQKSSLLVVNAFKDFELTFIVHASAEKQKTPFSHWLSQVGFDSESILKSQPGFRK